MSGQNKIAALSVVIFVGFSVWLGVLRFQDSKPVDMRGLTVKDLQLTIARTACFGRCPVYELELAADRRVHFNGVQHTAYLGETSKATSVRQLSELSVAIERSGFFEYQNTSDCVEEVTDMPSVILSVSWASRTDRVDRYLGCRKSGHDPVPNLAREIERILEIETWVGHSQGSGGSA